MFKNRSSLPGHISPLNQPVGLALDTCDNVKNCEMSNALSHSRAFSIKKLKLCR